MPRPSFRLAGVAARFDALRIGTRLALAFGLVLVLTVAIAALSLLQMSRISDASGALAERWLPGAMQLGQARAALLEHREFGIKHTRAADAGYMAEYEDKMGAAAARLGEQLNAYRALGTDPAIEPLVARADKAVAEYLATSKRLVGLMREGKGDDAREISDGAGVSALDDAVGAIDRVAAANFEGARATEAQAEAVHDRARETTLALAGVALLLGGGACFVITAGVLRQLGGEPRVAAQVVQAVAAGDLSTPVPLRAGDTGSLMARLAQMQSSLAQVVA
jgi:CHASE3 domain sensor protein